MVITCFGLPSISVEQVVSGSAIRRKRSQPQAWALNKVELLDAAIDVRGEGLSLNPADPELVAELSSNLGVKGGRRPSRSDRVSDP